MWDSYAAPQVKVSQFRRVRLSLLIKEATTKDIHDLILLGRNTYKEHFEQIWHDIDSFLDKDFSVEALIYCINNRHLHRYLLAVDDGDLLGFAKLNLDTKLPNQDLSGVELQKIYIKKNAVGQNIGSALLDESIKIAVDLKRTYIWLDVLKTNSKAQKFYERNQFEVISEIPFRTDKQEIGMFVMSKQLKHG